MERAAWSVMEETQMASSVDLKTYLTSQVAVLRELGQLLQEEQRAVAALDTGRMDALNLQKEAVQERQRQIIDEGRRVFGLLASSFGLPAETSLSRLIARFDRQQQPELLVLQKEAAEAATRVRSLAHENQGMLERFLGTVNDSLGYLLRVLNTSNQYGASGGYVQRRQDGAVMVSREV